MLWGRILRVTSYDEETAAQGGQVASQRSHRSLRSELGSCPTPVSTATQARHLTSEDTYRGLRVVPPCGSPLSRLRLGFWGNSQAPSLQMKSLQNSTRLPAPGSQLVSVLLSWERRPRQCACWRLSRIAASCKFPPCPAPQSKLPRRAVAILKHPSFHLRGDRTPRRK